MSQIKGKVTGASTNTNGVQINGQWHDATPAVAGYCVKLKGKEVEVVETGQENGKTVIKRVKPVGGGQGGGNSQSGWKGKSSGGKSGGYQNNNVGMQVGNALNNATALVVARDGANASVDGVVEVAKEILIASEQLAELVKSGALKKKAPEPQHQDDSGVSQHQDDSSFGGDDENFDDDIPF